MKMTEAVGLAKISGTDRVDEALGTAAAYGRFATGDLASILGTTSARVSAHRADEATSLAQGTNGWAVVGQPIIPVFETIATDNADDADDADDGTTTDVLEESA